MLTRGLLGNTLSIYLALQETSKLLFKMTIPLHIPLAMYATFFVAQYSHYHLVSLAFVCV